MEESILYKTDMSQNVILYLVSVDSNVGSLMTFLHHFLWLSLNAQRIVVSITALKTHEWNSFGLCRDSWWFSLVVGIDCSSLNVDMLCLLVHDLIIHQTLSMCVLVVHTYNLFFFTYFLSHKFTFLIKVLFCIQPSILLNLPIKNLN